MPCFPIRVALRAIGFASKGRGLPDAPIKTSKIQTAPLQKKLKQYFGMEKEVYFDAKSQEKRVL